MEEGMESFFQSKFQLFGEIQSHFNIINLPEKHKQYRQQTLSRPKSIKQYGFMKKFKKINQIFPYVSNIRCVTLETNLLYSIIDQIYENYLKFCRNGGWKSQDAQTHLEECLVLFLSYRYTQLCPGIKKICSHFDKFLLCFCYTVNYLKTCNAFIKTFAFFLNGSYSLGELFIYISLRNRGKEEGGVERVPAKVIGKVLKILEDENLESSFSISEEMLPQLEEEKKINLNDIFCQPSAGALMLGRVKMYKIMKICKIIKSCPSKEEETEEVQEEKINWDEFLKMYFNNLEEGEVNFEHILSASVSESLYQLSQTIFQEKHSQNKENFLEDAFSYVFSILEMVFYQKKEESFSVEWDQKTLQNITYLREMYEKAKTLNYYDITVTKRFSKTILKNAYLLELYRKYK